MPHQVETANPGPAGVRVCLFDMGGVVRHWPADVSDRAEDAAGLPRGVLAATASAVPEYEQGVLGWVTFDDWCHATERALANDHGTDAARIAVGAWHAGRGAIDRRVVDVITSVHRQVPVGLLSNAHDCLPRDLETHGLAGLFDEVVCSYAVHLAKPEPAIFACAARAFGVPPATCFFTDDLQPNVAAARAVGMRSHRFSGIEGLMVALTGAGIRVAPDT